jgi:peroxiredoxin
VTLTGRKSWLSLIALSVVVLIAACSGADEPTPGANPSPEPSIEAGNSDEPVPSVPPVSSPPPAPVFSFSTIDGEEVRLEDILGTAPVYVLFIPSVDTELDRTQVSRIQERHSQFEDLGVYVFMIASDLPTKVLEFRDELGLEFPVIADPLNVIATDWQVFDLFGEGKSGPASFVFNAHGVLIARLVAAAPGDRPSVDEVLGAIKESLNTGGV